MCTKHFPLHLPVHSAQVVAREGHTGSANVRKSFQMFKECLRNVQLKSSKKMFGYVLTKMFCNVRATFSNVTIMLPL